MLRGGGTAGPDKPEEQPVQRPWGARVASRFGELRAQGYPSVGRGWSRQAGDPVGLGGHWMDLGFESDDVRNHGERGVKQRRNAV